MSLNNLSKLWKIVSAILGCSLCVGCSSLGENRETTTQMSFTAGGTKGPVIVFQSGLGEHSGTWTPLISQLPKDSRYVVFDRLGYGKSAGLNDSLATPCAQAERLHQLLAQVGERPPYILVGHSLGGLYQYAFARMYPNEVSGLLLLDPTFPDHWQRLNKEAPASAAIVKSARMLTFTPSMRKEFDQQADCIANLPSQTLTAKQKSATHFLFSGRFNLGEGEAYQALLARERSDWLQLLPGSGVTVVSSAGHYIHQDQPDIVLKTLRDLLAKQ